MAPVVAPAGAVPPVATVVPHLLDRRGGTKPDVAWRERGRAYRRSRERKQAGECPNNNAHYSLLEIREAEYATPVTTS
jgi:hypothetical protein